MGPEKKTLRRKFHGESDFQIKNTQLKQTPIFVSHGEKDDVIPVSSFFKSKEFLCKNNCKFESHILVEDGHNISPETITLLQNFIKKIL